MRQRSFWKTASLVLAAALVCLPSLALAETTIRMATLAPRGSAWAKIMEKSAKELEKKTNGRVKIKYYFSGQQGDERDVVRKMKLGQLDGAAVTAVGLGLIKSDVRVLELPFLFSNDKQVDYVREKMAPEFKEAGYVLPAWGDVGWVHLFANLPVKSKADLQKTKMWAWTDDPIVRATFRRLGVNGIPLGVPDVLPSLQTGLINACYGSPLGAGALQWYTKVKYATNDAMSYAIGALVIRKEVFDKLDPADQKLMLEQGRAVGKDLMKIVRRDNERAKKAMQKSGIDFISVPADMRKEWESEGKKVWDELAGQLYSKSLLEQVKKYAAEAKAKHP